MTNDINARVASLLDLIPASQRPQAADLIAQYGPRLFEMAKADAWAYIRRILAGDLDAVAELDAALTDDEFIAKVKANTARWENVAAYNVARANLRNEIALRVGPIVVTILLALVGL